MYFLKLDTVGGHEFLWIYHSADKVLKYIPRTLKDGMGNEQTLKHNEHQLLMYYINHPNKIIIRRTLKRALDVPDDVDYLTNHRGAIADKFVESSGLNIPNIKQDIFKKGLHKNSTKTIFAFDVKKISEEVASQYCSRHIDNIMKNNQYLTNIYQALSDMNELHQLEMSADYFELFEYLLKKCPDEAKNLYRVDDVVLPFIMPNNPNIIFPIKIERQTDVVRHGYKDSLLEQKKLLNAKLYNGFIYRLLEKNQQTGELKLANCRYFDILDSADYLSSRLKSYYQKSQQQDKENQQLLRVVKTWANRMNQVMTGDFSQYNAGLGFSLPTFKILECGGLQLLCAKGSQQKATGAGKKHVCPAGMLEYWGESKNKALEFSHFKSIATKELLEETLLSDKLIRDSTAFRYYLDCFMDDGCPSEIGVDFNVIDCAAETIIDNWENIWQGFGHKKYKRPSLDAMLELRNSKDNGGAFMVIDALNYRPEIILPLYIDGDLNGILNWEYEDVSPEIITWKNIEELHEWVKCYYKDWCAPGLAAAYLGAKQYFEAKH